MRTLKTCIKLIGGLAATALVALVLSAASSQAYIPQPWCSDGTGNEFGCPRVRLQVVPAVRSQCGGLRGESSP